MAEQRDDSPSDTSRRVLLGSAGLAIGTALAGCSALSGSDDARSDVKTLERKLAETREENAALRTRIAELEAEVATYQRRLDAVNLWGFDEGTMDRLQAVANAWNDSIVVIDAVTEDGLWHVGTGWVYDDRIIATNAHVVQPKRLPEREQIASFTVWDYHGARTDGTLVGHTYGRDDIFDTQEDIGFLRVPKSFTAGRQMAHGVSRDLAPDEPLLQIGHPYSLEFWTPSVGPFINHREPFFASNVPGRPGVSGSPVLDLDGAVVGMTWGGQYIRRPQREGDERPQPGDGQVLPAFEAATNGLHSYMHRIHTAADALIDR